MDKRSLPALERASETTAAEVQVLKELAKTRADATTAVALAAEREPSGLDRSVDRLRSRGYSFVLFMQTASNWRRATCTLTWFLLIGAAIPVMTWRPGASLANPNKAAHRVTAVESVSDSGDT